MLCAMHHTTPHHTTSHHITLHFIASVHFTLSALTHACFISIMTPSLSEYAAKHECVTYDDDIFIWRSFKDTSIHTRTHAHMNTFKTVSIKNFTTDFAENCCAQCTLHSHSLSLYMVHCVCNMCWTLWSQPDFRFGCWKSSISIFPSSE